MFLAVPSATNVPFEIWRLVLNAETSTLQSQNLFYRHVQPVSSIKSNIVGASVRLDTNTLMAVDERFNRVYVFPLSSISSTTAAAYNTSYAQTTRYADLEFVGSRDGPSKMFFTSFDANASSLRAELYVQCAPCRDGGVSMQGAESQADCMCRPGSFATGDGGCAPCQCGAGQYQSGEYCTRGTETANVACEACGVVCPLGTYQLGTCDGSQTFNNLTCSLCRDPLPQLGPACPASLAVSSFESPCTQVDCTRRQALYFPFDGWDIASDLGPRGRHLVPVSASARSRGPTVHTASSRTGGVSASFDASNHEYFQIPAVPLFDRSLGYRIVRNVSMWERGMTLAFWVRFATAAGSGQTLVELSNGIDTENIYVRRLGATAELVFGVSHSRSLVRREQATANGTLRFNNEWQHVAWSIRPRGADDDYDALWSIFVDAGSLLAVVDVPGVMPIDGNYSTNYLGFGTPVYQPFFTGGMDDLRLYERALDVGTIRSIYTGHACCHSGAAGTYIDTSKSCTGLESFDQRLCRPCRSDCGPMHFISNFNDRCDGRGDKDVSTCLPCQGCTTDQYIAQVCSGVALFDEGVCNPCRHVHYIYLCRSVS